MEIKLESPRFALAAGELVRIENARGTSIRCAEGLLWVTQEGDHNDYVVSATDVLPIDRNGRTVVHAMRPTTFSIERTAVPGEVRTLRLDVDEEALRPSTICASTAPA
jgi:Protein of unknown function (DUF2917)